MATPPNNDPRSPRSTGGREEPLGRTASRASASRLEISARRVTFTGGDRQAQVPEGFPESGPPQRALIETGGRQCWICFFKEDDDRSLQWVKPCLCRGTMQWVHQNCLQQWIDRRYEDDKAVTPFCPHCRTKYLVYYPESGPLTRFLDFIDWAVEGTCPYIAGTVVVGSLYWTALCIGASAFLEAGDTDAKEIMENGSPVILMVTLPIIPALVIGLGMLKWEDAVLELLRNVSEYVPVTGYILPTRVRNVSGIFYNRGISEGMTCTRVFAGASVLPLASKWCGDLLYSSVESHFLRSFYGGLTFVGVKGLLIMYHRQQSYKRMSQRIILDRLSNGPLPRSVAAAASNA